MKKLLFLALLFSALNLIGNAQDSSSSHKKHKANTGNGMHKSAMKQLKLTPEQQAKIHASNKDYKAKSKNINNDRSLTENQKKAKIKSLHKDHKATIDKTLTADQKNHLKQIHKANKGNSPEKPKTSPKTT